MEFARIVLATLERGLFGWALIAIVLTTFELLNPRERLTLAQRVSGMAFWAVSIPVSATLIAGFSLVMTALDIRPLMTLPMFAAAAWAGPLAALVAVILAAIANDFFFYWFHRAQHRWLWRFHAVHHSIRDLSAVNSYHHISESVIALVLFTIPISLVVSDVGPVLPYANLLLHLHIVWSHSPTKITLGPLRALFADNRFHRIHHSLEERHFDRNFGAFTTLWDRLFGTACLPGRDEWPAVGLAEIDQPRGLREWIDLPLRYRAATAPEAEPRPLTA